MQSEAATRDSERFSPFQGPRAAWIWVALYFLFQTVATLLKLPAASPPWLIGLARLATIAGYMFLVLAMLAALATVLKTPPRAITALLAGLALWLFFLWARRQLRDPLAGLIAFNLLDLGRALAAAGIGAFVACLIRDPNILLPATVFAAFADWLMVYTRVGTVNKALQTEQGQKVIQSMSAHVPTPHASIAPLTVGMADYLFLAFFFACTFRFAMNVRATFIAFFVALTLSLSFVSYVNAIPALAPMALAFVAVNFRHFRLSRAELQAMGLAFAIVLIVVVGLFAFTR